MAEMCSRSVTVIHPPTCTLTSGVRQKVLRAYPHPIGFGYGAGMSVQPADSSAPARKTPAKTLDDVVRVMTGDVDADFKQQFQDALKKAWATARAECSLEPLTRLVENWHPYAVQWADPTAARTYYAELERVVRNGVPPESRGNALRAVEQLRAKHGPHPAFDKLESLAARY